MDKILKNPTSFRRLGFAGHLALLLGFGIFLVHGGASTVSTVALAVGAVLAGAGWIKAAPDERLLAVLGGWALALAPLIGIWIYAAFYPTKLDAAADLGKEVVVWMLLAFSLLAGLGLLRIVPRRNPIYLLAGLALVANVIITGVGMATGSWGFLMVAIVTNTAVQALAAAVFWPPRDTRRRRV